MNQSNITLQSNIQPINPNKAYDTDFLLKIHNLNALNKLRFKISPSGSMNTREYMFRNYQFNIVNNTGYGGYLNRDQCWGPVQDEHGNIQLCHKPLDTEEELKYFDPSDESAVQEYGYNEFINSAHHAFDVIINDNLSDEDEYGRAHTVEKTETPTVDLVALSKKTIIKEPEVSGTEAVSETIPYTGVNIKNVFSLFKESSQEEIIKASPNDVIFVDAGPGTGKTYTLINKINYMVTEQSVNPDRMLVLCFTNAAVDEIRERLKKFVDAGADRGLVNVDIRTFHSFAWWLIGQANELFCNDGWHKITMSGMSYDDSLKMATHVINRFSEEVVGNWEHFIVDEVQDLTNTLARFVLYIINACIKNRCGFTVLGDACQAIYDYMQDDNPGAMRSDEFYKALYTQIQGKVRMLKLTQNHRQSAELISNTSILREAILSQEHEKMEKATAELLERTEVLSKTGISIREEELEHMRKGGKICLLLRNNGQTLRLSSNLRKRSIEHILNSKTTDRNFASWIADVFARYTSKYISFEEFEELITGNEILEKYSAGAIWERLCRLLHTENDDLKVQDILEGILFSKIDDSILRVQCEGDIVVSTIHKAKGREYETVIADLDFAKSMLNEKANADEYKTLYVAVTRPKSQLFFSPLQKNNELVKRPIYDTGRERWLKKNSDHIVYFEFDSTIDLDVNRFAYAKQENFKNVSVGDNIVLRRKIDNGRVAYEIVHDDTSLILGNISNAYIEDMMHYMKLGPDKLFEMPDLIDDLYISGVYTQIVDSEFLKTNPEIAAVAPNGVWKWVEITGVGHLKYGVY